VGGCVRDLLLGRIDSPTDIDVTAPGEPETIRGKIGYQERESDFSFFYTEKFGTMTIIPKESKKEQEGIRRSKKEQEGSPSESFQNLPIPSSSLQYELTPLRTE
jgi:tRNA nucleotidyltransferase/poly(A) polymerase